MGIPDPRNKNFVWGVTPRKNYGLFDKSCIAIFIYFMKTTFDLPPDLIERSKIAAAKRRTSLKKLVIEGLERVLDSDRQAFDPADALGRLKKGYHLGNQPLSRDEIHAR